MEYASRTRYTDMQRTRRRKRRQRLRRIRTLCLLGVLFFALGAALRILSNTERLVPQPGSAPAVMAVQTRPEGEDWELAFVNADTPIREGYVPPLTDVGNGYQFDSRAAGALTQMLADARAAGLSPILCSAYRSHGYQTELFEKQVKKQQAAGLSGDAAVQKAKTVVAYPGTSEHQLGLAADIVALSYQLLDDAQAQTAEAKWLREHCADYGFILRYPPEKSDITGVIFEPWHFRYVGKAAARTIMQEGLTLEEYLAGSGLV